MAEAHGQNGYPTFDVAQIGQKQLDALITTQKDFLKRVEEASQTMTERAQSEMNLVLDFMNKLAASRTLPEAASAWQECMNKQLEMMAEDWRRALESGDKALKSGTRLFDTGGSSGFGT